MNFIAIEPGRKRTSSHLARTTVRAKFISYNRLRNKNKKKGISLKLYIGVDVAKEFLLTCKDFVSVSYDNDNKRNLLIKKSNNGFTLSKVNSDKPTSYVLNFDWILFTPTHDDKILHFVSHTDYEKNLLITL